MLKRARWGLALAALLIAAPSVRAAEGTAFHDFQPEKLKDCRKTHPFKLIDDPKMVSVSDASAFLKDEEYVLGVSVNGESRAFPTRFIAWHHGANLKVGGVPVAVTYCNVCNTGIGFDLRFEGKPIQLDFYGLYNGVVTLCDRATESVLLQADGRFVQGSLAGKSLKHVPVLDTTWAEWKKLHPDTQVMSPDTPYAQNYRSFSGQMLRGSNRLSEFFISTITGGDLRLKPFEKVLGVALAENREVTAKTPFRAYPLAAVTEAGGAVNEEVDGLPITVWVEPASQTCVALERKLEGKTLTFEARKNAAGAVEFWDKETGSRWNLEGKAETGPMAGKALTQLVANLSQWYGWSAYFPGTSIYGHTEAPMPGNPFAAPAEAK